MFVAILCLPAAAQPAAAVPFDVAYRAWDVVTDIARHNHASETSGDCGKQFRPFVIPGLHPQNRTEQAAIAQECVRIARSLCANLALERTREMERKCAEFR